MEHARILRLVVASPGDVQAERDSVAAVVEDLNNGIAEDRGLRLVVSRWETDAYPGFHPEGPQGLIDPILRIEDCDVLIGIFWKRFGTPVRDARSGTEHEFRLAYESWKKRGRPQIMVYFNQKSATPKSKAEAEQWGQVLEFRQNFPEEGLWWTYKNKNAFEKLLRTHLTQFIRNEFSNYYRPARVSASDPPSFKAPNESDEGSHERVAATIPEPSETKTQVTGNRGQTLGRQLLKACVVITFAIILTFLLIRVGLISVLETPSLNKFLPLIGVTSDVVIVRISDDDYKRMFQGKSPLDPMMLRNIIDAIARAKPAVIGVAIDTSAPQFQSLSIDQTWGSVVWAQDAKYSNVRERLLPSEVLGGVRPRPLSGLSVVIQDHDGIVRRYARLYQTEEGPLPSFPYQIVREYQNKNGKVHPESTDDLLIGYSKDSMDTYRFRISASEVLQISQAEDWGKSNPLQDKIVILGGEYDSQDEHQTPLGWANGSELIAQVVETELRGGMARPPSGSSLILLMIFGGLSLSIIFIKFETNHAFLISALLAPVLALLFSVVAFGSLSQWGYFAPVMLITILQHGYEFYKQ